MTMCWRAGARRIRFTVTDPLTTALANRADPRGVRRAALRGGTEAQITPAERRSIAARVWDVIARALGLG